MYILKRAFPLILCFFELKCFNITTEFSVDKTVTRKKVRHQRVCIAILLYRSAVQKYNTRAFSLFTWKFFELVGCELVLGEAEEGLAAVRAQVASLRGLQVLHAHAQTFKI